MIKDNRFHAFIVTQASRSRVRRVTVHFHWLKILAGFTFVVMCTALYGIYGLNQQAKQHQRIVEENSKLRSEKEDQNHRLNNLKNRVEAIEEASRRLAEMAGVDSTKWIGSEKLGKGGPLDLLDTDSIAEHIEHKTNSLEQDLLAYEAAIRKQASIPSIKPVEGERTDGFGTRRNPFTGYSSEFHSGEDIAAPWGTPVVAAADGVVYFAGVYGGYGQLVILDHGEGLTTRYGHLSKIAVRENQKVVKGQKIGNVGSTGRSTGPHLHYEVRRNDVPVNPSRYIRQKPPTE
jgi:murein DD-endopeptidase MepM/ murein hydrolase activator NlpD